MTADKSNPPSDDGKWRFDRKVPIALILTLAIQTVGLAYWGGTLTTRLDQVERRVEASAPQGERIIRLEERAIRNEEKLSIVQQGINEIKAILAGRSR